MATSLAEQQPLTQVPVAPSKDMAHWIAGLDSTAIPAHTFTWAKHAVLDWLGVTIAGAHEPLSAILVADALAEFMAAVGSP